MYHVLEAMVRWMAPILSFTADEIWSHMPARTQASPLFATWYQGLAPLTTEARLSAAEWDALLTLREAVNAALEPLRREKRIGSGLEAEIELYLPAPPAWLAECAAELRFLLLVSELRVHAQEAPAGAQVFTSAALSGALTATVTTAAKCVRCWQHRADVGQHPEHPQLCGRCIENVDGAGEQREWF
jgi:isoleucyl-tRNA synthetase